MKKRKIIATVLSLCLAMSMTACKQNDSSSVSEIADTTESSTTIEITFQSDAPVETEPTVETEVEETTPETATGTSNIEFSYEEFDEPITMYGALTPHGYYNNEFTRVGMITPNEEYVIIGEGTGFYYFTLDGVVYRAAKTSFSSEMVEIPPETEVPPETDPTTPPTEGTTPPPTEGTTPPPTSGTTPPPATHQPSDVPTEEALTMFRKYRGNIQQVNIEGYGSVWVVYYDCSSVVSQTNAHREELGLNTLSAGNQSYANTRAAEIGVNFSHTRPNGQNVGCNENITGNSASEAYNAWLNSEGHRANMENPNVTRIACASANVYRWVPSSDEYGGYFEGIGGGCVMLLE